jgi:mannose-6-phosphate isomerase-like protein (cupin superfamily)
VAHGSVIQLEHAEAIWDVGALLLVGATGAETAGQLTVIEARGGEGYAAPLHVHHHADEAFVVLEGQFRFECGDQLFEVGPGSVVFGPRGVPHRFRLDSPTGRLIDIHSPSGFEDFVRELGSPATSLTLPPPTPVLDPDSMRAIAARHGIEVIGPPLGPPTPPSKGP